MIKIYIFSFFDKILCFGLIALLLFNNANAQLCTFSPIGAVAKSQVSPSAASYTFTAVDKNGIPYLLYSDAENAGKATVMMFVNGGWALVGNAGFSAGKVSFTTMAIDASGTPYVVYQDAANSNKATVMKYNGTSWINVGVPGFSAGKASFTSMAIDRTGTPYVAYQDSANAYRAVVMKYNGSVWVNVGSAGFSPNQAVYTTLAIDLSGTLYIAYSDAANAYNASVMKYDGTAWVNVGAAGFSAAQGGQVSYISLAIDPSGTPYIAYSGVDQTNTYHGAVWKFVNGLWSQVGGAAAFSGKTNFTSLAIDASGTPNLGFADYNNSLKASVVKFNGSAWINVGATGFSVGEADYVCLALDASGTPYLAYSDYGNASKAAVTKFTNGTWLPLGSLGSFSTGQGLYASIAIAPTGTPYIAYQDAANSNKASVMKYDGTAWVNVGIAGFSVGKASFTTLAIDKSGTPYVAYQDSANSYKAVVMKYNGSAWVNVGIAGFSPGQAAYTSIALDASGNPYIAFTDAANNYNATVMKYDGNAWVYVGTPGFSAGQGGQASRISIALDASGIPYVAYAGVSTTNAHGAVWRYANGLWAQVGGAAAFSTNANFTSIAIDAGGTPYLAFADYSVSSQRASVVKFNGNAWVNVGAAGFSVGEADYASIALDSIGTPYVVYSDFGNSSKTVVMRYANGTWSPIGNASGISTSSSNYTSIAIDRGGTPYVVYNSNGVFVQKAIGGNSLPAGTTVATNNQATATTQFANCPYAIAQVQSTGSNPISGNVTANVWVDASPSSKYIARHYDITPADNASTATATITLYALQADFDAFNNQSPAPSSLLPTNPSDVAGKANLRIFQIHGTSSDGSGSLSSYTGTSVGITPSSVIWNSINNWWEMTFSVTGFSGFFITSNNNNVLPVHWISVTGNINNQQTATINWQVSETNVASYELQKSNDATHFSGIGKSASKGDGVNNYSFTDATLLNTTLYYRVKELDKDGNVSYSNIVKVSANSLEDELSAFPNPTIGSTTISIGAHLLNNNAQLFDMSGRLLQSLTIRNLSFTIDMSSYTNGIYFLRTTNGKMIKIEKE